MPSRSCIITAAAADGKDITTIEGISQGDRLHPIQEAFAEDGVLQCGYCAPGMVLTAVALLRDNPVPTDQQIEEAMNGNICRCCAYPTIIAIAPAIANAVFDAIGVRVRDMPMAREALLA